MVAIYRWQNNIKRKECNSKYQMSTDDKRNRELKMVFSIVSLLLMIPPLLNSSSGNTEYYRTLFIFLINKVIDMVLQETDERDSFFMIWRIINKCLGIVACAVALSSLAPDFASLFRKCARELNICLLVAATSCVLKEAAELISLSVQEGRMKQKIRKEMASREGDTEK